MEQTSPSSPAALFGEGVSSIMAKWLKRGAFHLDQENMDFSAVSFQAFDCCAPPQNSMKAAGVKMRVE